MTLKSESGSETYVVRCRGLPWSVTKDEIAEFFDNCELTDEREKSIILTKNREGRFSGEAYVILASKEDFDEALKKDRKHMGSRYVEVFTAQYEEIEWAINRSEFGAESKDNVVRLRGLPWKSTKEDVVKFFEGIQINPNCIMLTNDSMGRSSGEAFVQFNSKEDLQDAMKRNRQLMGWRYIEIFPSSMNDAFSEQFSSMAPSQEMRRPGPYDRSPSGYGRGFGRNIKGVSNRPNFSPMAMGAMVPGLGEKVGHLIRMRGLPFSATEMEVAEWFSLVADPVHIEIEYNKEGRPSGEAKVYFKSAEDAKRAMSKNKQNMQHRYIELFSEGIEMGGQEPMSFGVGRGFLMGSGMNMGMGGNMGIGMSGMGLRNAGGMTMSRGGLETNNGMTASLFPNTAPQFMGPRHPYGSF